MMSNPGSKCRTRRNVHRVDDEGCPVLERQEPNPLLDGSHVSDSLRRSARRSVAEQTQCDGDGTDKGEMHMYSPPSSEEEEVDSVFETLSDTMTSKRQKKRRRRCLQRGNPDDGVARSGKRSCTRGLNPPETSSSSSSSLQLTNSSSSLARRSPRTQAAPDSCLGRAGCRVAAREVLDLSAAPSSDVIRLDCEESSRPLPPPSRRRLAAFEVDNAGSNSGASSGGEAFDTTWLSSTDAATPAEDRQRRIQDTANFPEGERDLQSSGTQLLSGPRAAMDTMTSAEVSCPVLHGAPLSGGVSVPDSGQSARSCTSGGTPSHFDLLPPIESQVDGAEDGTIGVGRALQRDPSVQQYQGQPSVATGSRGIRVTRNIHMQRVPRALRSPRVRSRARRSEAGTSTRAQDRSRDTQELHDEELARQLQSEEDALSSWDVATSGANTLGIGLVDVSSGLSDSSDELGRSSERDTPMRNVSWQHMNVTAEMNQDDDEVIEVDVTANTSSGRREDASGSSRVRGGSRGGVDGRGGSTVGRGDRNTPGGREGSRRPGGSGLGAVAGTRGAGVHGLRSAAASSRPRGGRSSRVGSLSSESRGRRQRSNDNSTRSGPRRQGAFRLGVADSFPMPGILGLQLVLGGTVGEGIVDRVNFVGEWGTLARELGNAGHRGRFARGRMNASNVDLLHRDLTPADYERLLALDDHNGDGGGSSASGASRGLSERELSLMPIEIGTGSGLTQQCCICMEDMKSTDAVTRLPACIHVYHSECISKWLKEQATCPIDKTAVCFSRP